MVTQVLVLTELAIIGLSMYRYVSGCAALLSDPSTTIPQVFAILRQWTPQTQQSLEMLIREVNFVLACEKKVNICISIS